MTIHMVRIVEVMLGWNPTTTGPDGIGSPITT